MEIFLTKLVQLSGPLLGGALTTISITLASLVIAIALGLALALIRLVGIAPPPADAEHADCLAQGHIHLLIDLD